ncbi:MAG: hypothetical protein IH988_10850, partial [Planctomycetes bacterium]|nr:hypothetical protein [Planctomycetota bacterium]
MVIRVCAIVALSFFGAGSVLADATAEAARSDVELVSSEVVNELLNLTASTVVQWDLTDEPGVPLTVVVPVAGQNYTVELQPHTVRSADYQLKVQIEDGSIVDAEPGAVRTLRGRVVEVPGSVVAGSLLESGLQAKIVFNDDLIYWVEPLAPHLAGVAPGSHVVYNSLDVQCGNGTCGLAAVAERKIDPLTMGARGAPCGATFCVAELGIDADEFLKEHPTIEIDICECVLNGGWEKWVAEGRAVSTSPGSYPAATFLADPQWRQGLANKEDVLAALQSPGSACVVDALSAESYSGMDKPA